MNIRFFASLFVLCAFSAAPMAASACPLCKEAISTSDAGDEVNNMPAAYNNSIYLMISVPYASLGLIGFIIYRGVQKNAAYFDNQQFPSHGLPNREPDAR